MDYLASEVAGLCKDEGSLVALELRNMQDLSLQTK
jgi:hypothetical protein